MLCVGLWSDPEKNDLIYIWFSPNMLLLLVKHNFTDSEFVIYTDL